MKINLLGDIALNDLLSVDANQIQEKFKAILDSDILSDGITICNLETPIQYQDILTTKNGKSMSRVTTPAVLDKALELLKIDIVSIANNHILDTGDKGLLKTCAILSGRNILYSGIRSETDDLSLVILEKHNLRIGFIAYVHLSTNPFSRNQNENLNIAKQGVEIPDFEQVKKDKSIDILIISIHWGKDYSNYFEKWQQEYAHELIDRGSDVILGHHPHTLQPYEIYKDKPIFYSMGGFCFGDFYWEGKIRSLKRKTKLGGIAVIDESLKIIDIVGTRELKNNYVIQSKSNLRIKLRRLYRINLLKNKYWIIAKLVILKESVVDRLYEFLLGYHRNLFSDILNIRNFKKLKFILRDIKG